jgi:5-(carboxyamino)imidazole ribonucleotide synthase
MFAIAARRMGYRVHTFSPDEDTPTGQVADLEIQAPYEDLDAVRKFASNVSVVTFEFENVPAQTAAAAADCTLVRPGGEVLHTTQHRLREKSFLSSAGLPLTSFRHVSSLPDLRKAVIELGFPCVLKTADFGYDGKGQFRLLTPDQIPEAWQVVGPQDAVLEAFVDFQCEVSVVAARGAQSEFVHFGTIENHHSNGILDVSLSPARIPVSLSHQAVEITRTVFEKLNVIGVLCVEFFVTKSGQLLINELAPRPHNSGHLTVDANITSQFEQQLRCVCGLPLGETKQLAQAAMTNLLGDLWTPGEPDWLGAAAQPNVKIHLYGKLYARPGRKMGHLTALSQTVEGALSDALQARQNLQRSRL